MTAEASDDALMHVSEFCDTYAVCAKTAYWLVGRGDVEAREMPSQGTGQRKSIRIVRKSAALWAASLPKVQPKKTRSKPRK